MPERDHVLLRGVRPVDLEPSRRGAAPPGDSAPAPVDLRLRDGVITEIGPHLPQAGAEVLDGGGRWVIPGLWDAHVHMGQWAATKRRLDLSDTIDPDDVLARLREHLRTRPAGERTLVEGFGWRLGSWPRRPSTAELDAVVGDRPVVLISGDCHAGWLSSAAYRALGEPVRPSHVDEDAWFAMWGRLGELPQDEEGALAAYAQASADAAAKGVVGIVDLEWEAGRLAWPARVAAGLDTLRVRPATYLAGLEDTLAAGVATGDVLDTRGLVTMGPFKVIADGSLNTRTAWCCDPFVTDDHLPEPYGVANVDPAELTELLRRAHAGGLEAAVHAIGDAAFAGALTAFAGSGAPGSIEHAQLVRREDLPRMAALGVRASVQPVHLLDDRDTTEMLWPDRAERCFAFASMAAEGVELSLGSDAPVAPLDPWLAMAAAVHRSGDERDPWVPQEALSPLQALRASVDGRRLEVGAPADLVLLPGDVVDVFAPVDLGDPASTRAAADRLRSVEPVATLVAGRVTAG